jgi:hypothetical protein
MDKYGKLTIIEIVEKKKYKNGSVVIFVKCKCECGNEKIINFNNIKRGLVKSCGCIVKTRNGLSKTREYQIYRHIINRCFNQKDINYKNYGGRGIKVCDEWINNFEAFYNWATKNGYTEKLTIDRINVNGDYEPANCRWTTMKQQQNNRTNNRIIEYRGKRKTITEWAIIYNMSYRNLYYRLKNGYSIEQALEKPKRKSKRP